LPGRHLIPTGHARSGHRPRTERTPSISSQPVPPHQSRPVWQTSPDRAPVRESVRTAPRPRRLSSLTLDHAFGGSSTLDFRPWTRWKVSRPAWQRPFQAAGAHPERLRHKPASVNLPRQAAGKEPRVSTRLETTRKISSTQIATWNGGEVPGGLAAVECASGRCLTPLGLKRDRIGTARDPRPALRSDLGYRISPRWG